MTRPSFLTPLCAGLAAGMILSTPAQAQEFDCVIEPAIVVELASPVGGLVGEMDVSRGDVVSRGQQIARLESGVEETTVELMRTQAGSAAEIEAFRARLVLAQSRRDRLRTLVERNISSKEDLEDAEASVEVATREVLMAELRQRAAGIELKRAEAVLRQRTITSPIDGIVLERMRNTGEYADRDIALIRIAQLNPLHVEAFLPIDMFAKLKTGDTATVRPNPPITGTYAGRLTVVDQVFDAASSTFGVRVEIENQDLAIPAGHRCIVEFDTTG